MTSIKKCIDDWDRNIARCALNAYCASLACVGKNTDRAIPGLKAGLRVKLTDLANRVGKDATAEAIEESRHRFEWELSHWADSVIEDLQKKTLDVKEMMLTLAAAAERIAQRDNTNSARFGELTARLQSIVRLEDITAIRRQLTESVTDLKANVSRMEEEGRATVLNLQNQLEIYKARAVDSERRASLDQLTGIRNRRGLEDALESHMESHTPFSLILLDLNGFKRINDTHGHPVGDDLLRQFANELREQFRAVDVVGRWGGDEFIVITDAPEDELESCMNRVRRWVLGKYKVQTPDGTLEIKLDASIGVAAWDLREDADRLLARADRLMYAEKRVHA
jgi:diguanylate cyclase (GGDEF)-like protein